MTALVVLSSANSKGWNGVVCSCRMRDARWKLEGSVVFSTTPFKMAFAWLMLTSAFSSFVLMVFQLTSDFMMMDGIFAGLGSWLGGDESSCPSVVFVSEFVLGWERVANLLEVFVIGEVG